MNDDKRWFLVEYVLRRALAVREQMDGEKEAYRAEVAWKRINEMAPVAEPVKPEGEIQCPQ